MCILYWITAKNYLLFHIKWNQSKINLPNGGWIILSLTRNSLGEEYILKTWCFLSGFPPSSHAYKGIVFLIFATVFNQIFKSIEKNSDTFQSFALGIKNSPFQIIFGKMIYRINSFLGFYFWISFLLRYISLSFHITFTILRS